MPRKQVAIHYGPTLSLFLLLPLSGCMSGWINTNSDENRSEVGLRRDEIKKRLQEEDRPRLISEIGSASLLTQSVIENIGLVTQLRGTGGIVKASSQREKMLDMMRRRDVNQPNTFLDDPSTSLVVVSSVVPPAARKGAPLDAVVKLSTHAEANDLQHGWLMETPLMEMSVLGGQLREGFERAKVQGSIVTNFQINGSEENEGRTQGIIIGAGSFLKQRNLGIALDAEFADAITMSAIVPKINQRFTYFDGQRKSGIATPREASLIELEVPPQYEHDPFHYVNVVLRIGFNETPAQRSQRLASLRSQLFEPSTVREASWQLEAIGEEAIPVLAEGLNHPDDEIRFYAAHALAYLDDKRAIPQLKALCLKEPAFRAMCLNGLTILNDFEAEDTLRAMLHSAAPEVRYGAVRALRKRDPADLAVTGQPIEKAGNILEIPSSGPPLVALSLSQVAEVVIFGESPQLHVAAFQYVNPRILVSPKENGKLAISHFSPGQDDQVIECNSDLRSALVAIAEVGGTYGDWVSFLRECHAAGCFVEPFAMNPIPVAGRTYNRSVAEFPAQETGDLTDQGPFIAPELFDEEDESDSSVKIWNPLTWGSERK